MTYSQALAEYRQTITDLGTTIEATARAANLYRIHSKGRDDIEHIGSVCYPAWVAEEKVEKLNRMPAYQSEGIYHWIEAVGE